MALSRANRALGARLTSAEIAQIVESSFEHAARFWGESLFIRRRLATGDWRRFVAIRMRSDCRDIASADPANSIESLRRDCRGRLFVSAYLGNPAVAAVTLGRIFGHINVVADYENQPLMQAWRRDLAGLKCIRLVDRMDAAVAIPRALDANQAVFMIGEHVRPGNRGVRAHWLGRDIHAYPTIGLLAARHNARVVPVTCTRASESFRFELNVDIPVDRATARDNPEAIVRATLASLQRSVLGAPQQYLWAMPD